MEFTKDEKNALEWLLIKGMEITKSNKKHGIFDTMHERLVNNLPISGVVVPKGTLCPDVMDLNIDSEISYCDKCGKYHN